MILVLQQKKSVWSCYDDDYKSLSVSNTLEINKNELICDYVLDYGKIECDEKNDTCDLKVEKRENFQIKYFYENNKWNTKDTVNYEKIYYF